MRRIRRRTIIPDINCERKHPLPGREHGVLAHCRFVIAMFSAKSWIVTHIDDQTTTGGTRRTVGHVRNEIGSGYGADGDQGLPSDFPGRLRGTFRVEQQGQRGHG